jgi:UDP-galactopyranose mutase
VLAQVNGQLVPFPINVDTIDKLFGKDISPDDVERELYERFFRNYMRKLWGFDPAEVDAAIAVRPNHDDRYFTDEFQAMPLNGYTRLFENMLDHDNITIVLNTDYRELIHEVGFAQMIYTGPIDAFFDYRFGRLPYRSLELKFETHDQEVFQPAAVVDYPNDHAYTRITEFKYLTGQTHAKTSIVYEFPCADGEPCYPLPGPENAETYRRYKSLADQMAKVRFVGRLATYRHYEMDQVVGQALAVFDQIKGAASGQTQTRAA